MTAYAGTGFDDGYADGWAGRDYYPDNLRIPAEHDATYRINYAQGYEEGQDAYRRAMEGLVP
jgi:hypothetical protein